MDISKYILDLRKKFLRDEHYNDIKDINWGSCADFAYALCKVLGENGIKGTKIKTTKGMFGGHSEKHFLIMINPKEGQLLNTRIKE